jgi:hypothetical protein
VIDAETVLQTAVSGTAPPSWSVLRPRRVYVVAFQVVPVLLMALAIGAYVALRALLSPHRDVLGPVGNIVFGVVALVLGGLVVILYLSERDALSRHMVVLMPEGCVVYLGGPVHAALVISYAAAVAIQRRGLRRSQYLVTRTVDGNYKPWRPGIEFGQPDAIIRRILLARDAYAAIHEPLADGGPGPDGA